MSKKALITGITGQDGSYLAEFLLEKGYDIHGLVRRLSTPDYSRIRPILNKIRLIDGDLSDQRSLIEAVKESQPDEVYNLGAQSFVPYSWKSPDYTSNITGLGVTRILEAIRIVKPDTRFYQASSSEMFGKVEETPQNEKTKFHPRSPYGVAKVYGYHATVNYRESYNLFACNGILFNHESPRRGTEFVTKKITNTLSKIKLGLENILELGNLNAKRDWGFARDYVRAMWLMLQQEKPDDYVVASEESHSVREFVEEAAKCLKMEIGWRGKDKEELGFWKNIEIIKINKELYRPAEVHELLGDASKAREKLGWKPEVSFKELIRLMIEYDLRSY